MKKVIAMLCTMIFVCITLLVFSSCGVYNKQLVDFTYSYERAIIELPNGEVVDGKVSSWADYENSDQIQVKIDGKQYLVHSSDIVLISN